MKVFKLFSGKDLVVVTPSRVAKRIIDELGISSRDDLKHLEAIAWVRGALVTDKQLDGAEARLVTVRKKAIITVSTTIRDPRRRRFSIAHELGHLEMHRYDSSLALCTKDDLDDWESHRNNPNREQQANEFASALLLPDPFFAPLCEDRAPSLELISDLAEKFDVSLTATALRYLQFAVEPCAIVFSKDGFVRWFRGSKDFNDLGVFIEVRVKPDPNSLAASFFNGKTISDKPRRVSATTWLETRHLRRNVTIVEQACAMTSYNSVLTLIWIDEDIEDDDFEDGDC